ncbi:MAG: 4Fe-4S dicluster domain-containing protein [Anaerolineaceae bacterium]
MSHTALTTTFADEVRAIPGGENLEMCFSCGTCTSKCMIQSKLDGEYNPRRLIRKVMFDMESEAFSDVTTWLCTACDLCYSACPQKIHISGVINAVKKLAVDNAKMTIFKTAVVDQQTCVACGLCAEACPYEAIALKPSKIPYRGLIQVATVDPALCMACGLCSAVCRSTSIGIPEDYSDKQLVDNLWDWLQMQGAES